jgi:hypothetical protein
MKLTAGAQLLEKRGGGGQLGKACTEEENVFCKIRQRRARAGRLRGLVGWVFWAGEGLDVLGRLAGQGRGSGQAGWAEWAKFGGRILFE